MSFGIWNPMTQIVDPAGSMQQSLVQALTEGVLPGGPATAPVTTIPPLEDVPGVTKPPVDDGDLTTGQPVPMSFGDAFGLAFAPYMQADPMEAGGGEQAARWSAQLAMGNPGWLSNTYGGLNMSDAFDPANEQFQRLTRDVALSRGARGGGGDGGR